MPAPSPLMITTQAVQRLVKEEKYYRKELAQQSERVQKLEKDLQSSTDQNAEFVLKQERQAMQETRGVFAPLHTRIAEAVERLEEQIATAESESGPADELKKASEALELGKGLEEPPAAA
ncbi:tubulin binding cofactor A [Hypoxylon fragiforme]|uniref:tubulin binding cofactor A n=1 Tax=Hypoxylon fragiforme TaxID=63214 RepID=UPI0020C69860|nr:tubulin binding cofactor A [Hypoxylon fragiforme]KAI2613693.1 tubulin binding cofactor A [Hypoxylon fragiforme]